MTAVLLGTYEPNSPEWHAVRAQGIGASEIAAVVGLSPFESPFSLWHRKAGNLSGPDPSNPLFYWGHALEPLVADRFAEGHPQYVVANAGTFCHENRGWQVANPDRILRRVGGPDAILEIKTTRYPDGWGPHGSTEIPVHVRCQVMQQMDVMGVPFAWVAVLIGGNDYREYRIDYDPDDAQLLRESGAAFWESLQTSDEPPIDASWETYRAVREIHPEIDEDADIEIDPDLHAAYLATKTAADEAKAAHQQIKSALLNAMGRARRALVDGTPVMRRQPARGDGVALYSIRSNAA